jgi:hypothetical protein
MRIFKCVSVPLRGKEGVEPMLMKRLLWLVFKVLFRRTTEKLVYKALHKIDGKLKTCNFGLLKKYSGNLE